MAKWLRCIHNDDLKIGMLIDGEVLVYDGNMFAEPQSTGERFRLEDVTVTIPCRPNKMLALWNNFHSRAVHEGWQIPPEPLYFVKTENSFNAHLKPIQRPSSYMGPVFFEGELGIVIGKQCCRVTEIEASHHIFGYTCVNDVTAKEILKRDPSFPQWTRAKCFDSFGIFGPVIETEVEVDRLVIQTRLDGELLQEYSVTDMVFHPYRLVSLLSQDMTLYPGDVIACGTGLGAQAMQDGQIVEVSIEGVGILRNRMVNTDSTNQ